jgi:pilus assembly protein CpaE
MFDFIVIDGGRASFNAVSKTAMSAADTLLLVANPTLPCVVNMGRLIDAFQSLGCPGGDSIGIVFNRHDRDAGISLAQAEQTLRKKVSWLIPNDYKTAISAINNGQPLCAVARTSELHARIDRMAAEIAGRKGEKEARKGFLFGLLSNAKTGDRKAGTWS